MKTKEVRSISGSYNKAFQEGRQSKLKEELIFLGFVLNTNDKYRIGEIEKRVEQIKKELGVKK